MIYFNKLIDICINCQESQKVVNNYFVGTKQVKRGCKKVPYFIDFLCKILYNIFKCNFFIPYSLISGGKTSHF